MPLAFERLDPSRHDRDAFSCGETSLDDYLKRRATQDARRNVAFCYVLCEPGDGTIVGYYTLSAYGIEPASLPAELANRLPRYDLLPAALLGRLAVASAYQNQKMGQRLLIDAIQRATAADLAATALVVEALDQRAAAFYSHFDFRSFAATPLRLYLPLRAVRGRV